MPTYTVSIRKPERTVTATVLRNARHNIHLTWAILRPRLEHIALAALWNLTIALDWVAMLTAKWCVYAVHHSTRGIAWACREVGELAEDVAWRTR